MIRKWLSLATEGVIDISIYLLHLLYAQGHQITICDTRQVYANN